MANNRNLNPDHEINESEQAESNGWINQLFISIPEHSISVESFADNLPNFSYHYKFSLKELNRIPQRHYKDVDGLSMQNSLFGKLPEELWVLIYSFLDVKSLLQLSMACKLLGLIANEGLIRERLYKPKNHFQFFKIADKNNCLKNLTIPNFSINVNTAFPIQLKEPSMRVYNDHPELGFVLKK